MNEAYDDDDEFEIAAPGVGETIPEPPESVLDHLVSPDHGTDGLPRALVRRTLGKVPGLRSLPFIPTASSGWGTPSASYGQTNIVAVKGRGITIHMHREVAYIFGRLLVDLDDHLRSRGKSLAVEADDWGYAHRKIRGRNEWSNHAWGLAADFNAIRNPMGDRLITEFDPKWVRNLMKGKYKALIRWGGDYRGRKDAMHFEFMGTPAQARSLTASLKKKAPAPKPKPDPAPNHKHPRTRLTPGMNGDVVRDLQGHLNYAFRAYAKITPLKIDGDFGNRTEVRLREWTKRTGLGETATVDDRVWHRLHSVTKGARQTETGKPF